MGTKSLNLVIKEFKEMQEHTHLPDRMPIRSPWEIYTVQTSDILNDMDLFLYRKPPQNPGILSKFKNFDSCGARINC